MVSIPRKHLMKILIDDVCDFREVFVYGPAHWGKSYLLQSFKNIMESQKYEVLYLDLQQLQHKAFEGIDREATRCILADEAKFLSLNSSYASSSSSCYSMFAFFLKMNLSKVKSIIVIDSISHLSDSPDAERWFISAYNILKDLNIMVVFAETTTSFENSRLKRIIRTCDMRSLEVPRLTKVEIKDWVKTSEIGNGLSVTDIMKVTGGIVGFVRDLALFRTDAKRAPLEIFITNQANHYSPSCQRVFNAILKFPAEMKNWKSTKCQQLLDELWLSGVFYKTKQSRLRIASPIHSIRINNLITIENVLDALSDKTLESIENTERKLPLEVVIIIIKRLMQTTDHYVSALHVFIYSIQKITSTSVVCFIRDEGHPLIWKEVVFSKRDLVSKGLIKLSREKTDHDVFFEIINYGKRISVGNTCYYPIIGPSGQVDMIVKVNLPTRHNNNEWHHTVHVRTIDRLLRLITPEIRRNLAAYYHNKHKSVMRTLLHRINKRPLQLDEDEMSTILIETTAKVIAVMSASTDSTWYVTIFQANSSVCDNCNITANDLMINQCSVELTTISDGNTGLALSKRSVERIFPRLLNANDHITMFVKPVPVLEGGSCIKRLVIYIFIEKSELVIDSYKKHFLSLMAQRLVHIDFVIQKWREYWNDEIEVMNAIGLSMSHALADPERAIKEILDSLMAYFKVSTVSLNDVVTVNKGNRTVKIVRMNRGVGYSDGYDHITYELGNSDNEGKTGYVARSGKTIVSWNNSIEKQAKEVSYLDHVTGSLITLKEEIMGSEQCSSYMPEGHVYCFLGTPIVWKSGPDEKEEIIGVLKMANRHVSTGQQFTSKEVDAARRIAQLIAPFLYIIQFSSRFGIGGRLKTMRAFLIGIEHELKKPITSMKWKMNILTKKVQNNLNCDSELRDVNMAIDAIKSRINDLQNVIQFDIGVPVIINLYESIRNILDERINDCPNIVYELSGVSKDSTAKIDENQFKIVIDNICRNAEEAVLGIQGARIKIQSQGNVMGNFTSIIISDNGPGISEELGSKSIFDPFISSKRVNAGNPDKARGIGLTLTREIIENNGGMVTCDRTNNETIFTIDLPSK